MTEDSRMRGGVKDRAYPRLDSRQTRLNDITAAAPFIVSDL